MYRIILYIDINCWTWLNVLDCGLCSSIYCHFSDYDKTFPLNLKKSISQKLLKVSTWHFVLFIFMLNPTYSAKNNSQLPCLKKWVVLPRNKDKYIVQSQHWFYLWLGMLLTFGFCVLSTSNGLFLPELLKVLHFKQLGWLLTDPACSAHPGHHGDSGRINILYT